VSTLTDEVAQRIVDRTMAVIGRNVNVMDARGLILASGDPARRRERHEGALLAVERDRPVVLDASEARLLRGAQPGVNVPLRHHGTVVGAVGISGDPAEVHVLADLIRVTAELIVEQAGALESGQRLQQERDDHLVDVIEGRVGGEAAARRATELGIADVRRRCTLVRPTGERGHDALRSVRRRLARRSDLLLARTRPDELAVWWPDDVAEAAEEVARAVGAHEGDLLAAAGEGFAGPEGLRRAWLAADDALAVSQVSEHFYDARDVGLVALLCGLREDWRADVVSAPWRALVEADLHGELRATLQAWFEHDMSPARCAAALHIHRNTLRARLERIERVTGLELRRVTSLLRLYLGPLLAPPTS
jgi:carbohydrate diacid regulator